jgi:hypothetical protein
MKFELVSATSLTTAGTFFWLTCPEASRTNANYTSVFGLEQTMVWRETSPIPTLKSNQMLPFEIFIQSGAAAANDIVSFPIHLRSDGAITPGFSIVWDVSWVIDGPDNLIKAV